MQGAKNRIPVIHVCLRRLEFHFLPPLRQPTGAFNEKMNEFYLGGLGSALVVLLEQIDVLGRGRDRGGKIEINDLVQAGRAVGRDARKSSIPDRRKLLNTTNCVVPSSRFPRRERARLFNIHASLPGNSVRKAAAAHNSEIFLVAFPSLRHHRPRLIAVPAAYESRPGSKTNRRTPRTNSPLRPSLLRRRRSPRFPTSNMTSSMPNLRPSKSNSPISSLLTLLPSAGAANRSRNSRVSGMPCR